MAHDVFISYATKDKVVADAVCAALEADHIRCYIAPRDVLPGQRYAQALVDAIHNAKAFVLVFSAASNASNQVEREVDRAVSCGLPILPLRVEDVMPCDWLEYYLAGQHWLDALTPPLENHLTRLSEAIGVLLQLPAKSSRSPLTDGARGDVTIASTPKAAAPGVDEPKTAAPPAPTEQPPVVKRPMEYVPPRAAAKPPITPPPEALKPPVAPLPTAAKPPKAAPPPTAAKPPEARTPPKTVVPRETATPSTPAVAKPAAPKPAPAVAKPAAAPKPTPAVAKPAASKPAPAVAPTAGARAPAAGPETTTAAAAPARRGRRTAVIAAAVVGASWIGVLLAVELLFR